MTPEQDRELVALCPNLYFTGHEPGVWGFDVGQGWFELIKNLSLKLEKIIVEYRKQFPNPKCSTCDCAKHNHSMRGFGGCLSIFKLPKLELTTTYRPAKNRWQEYYYSAKEFAFDSMNWVLKNTYYQPHPCWCKKYIPDFPRAVQIKEKFGGLRFYLNFELPEMTELIQEAQKLSFSICETCGVPGKRRGNRFWTYTACENHVRD